MELTSGVKAYIDSLSYEELLRRWRFAPAGDPYFQRPSGDYWAERMNKLKETVNSVQASKNVEWEEAS